MLAKGFIQHVQLVEARVPSFDAYPFNLPVVRSLRDKLVLDPRATIFVGENGSGKSTLVEAIAVAAGLNPEGGSANFNFSTRSSESPLGRCLRLARTERRARTAYFLRAESLYNVATNIEELDREGAFSPPIIDSYGGRSLHEQSHGESFSALVHERFGASGFYVMDEPEAALSPRRQISLVARMNDLISAGSQFVVATHSPILAALPGALVYLLSESGIRRVAYEETDCFRVMKNFLDERADRKP
jgi:predicted ATPase